MIAHVRFGSRLCENLTDAMIPLLNRGGLMKGFVQGADRQQTTLLPECLDDWVDESNPVMARPTSRFAAGIVAPKLVIRACAIECFALNFAQRINSRVER